MNIILHDIDLAASTLSSKTEHGKRQFVLQRESMYYRTVPLELYQLSRTESGKHFLNLIDENSFLVSYPEVPDDVHRRKTGEKFAKHAMPVR